MLYRVAFLTYFHPRKVLAGVAIFLIAAVLLGGDVADRLQPAGFTHAKAESSIAAERINDGVGYEADPGLIIVATPSKGRIKSGKVRKQVQAAASRLRADPDVAFVNTGIDSGAPASLISRGRDSTLIFVHFDSDIEDLGRQDAAERIPGLLDSENLDLQVGGFAAGFTDVNEAVREDLLRAELIAFPILAILLVLVFRGLVAASLPLIIGGIAVVGTFLGLRILSEFTDVSVFALNIATALGLGLAVDYGLLLTSRFREELEVSGPGWEAHRRTVETAGRAVLFSGLTVATAVAAIVVMPERFIYSMGAGAAIVSIMAAAAALLATPAMFALLGDRVNALSVRSGPPSTQTGRWYQLVKQVQKRPFIVAATVIVVLLACAAPVRNAVLTQPGVDAVPLGKESRTVTETLRADYTPNLEAPISALVGPGDDPDSIYRQINAIEGIAVASPPRPLTGDTALIQAIPAEQALTPEAQEAAREIRGVVGPDGGVAGQTVEFIDFKKSLVDHAPLVGLIVAVSTMFLLFLMTGSLILPLKTLLMNLLTITAAFGLLVVVFQDGLLSNLFAYEGPAAIDVSLLVVLGATTFGLATDYSVLVLARIKEFHDEGHSNRRSVALGIDRTGRVITAAAVLLAVVFLAFTTSSIFFMKQVGFAQAVAVLIDASIIRALLVPALMQMFGDWNWWAPKPLRSLHRRLGLSHG